MIRNIYIDTSVFGGYYDTEFAIDTRQFFDKVINDKITIFVSDNVTTELENAPDNVKEFYKKIPQEIIKIIEIKDDIQTLADKYIEANVVSKKHHSDCIHIAAATISNADIVVS